MEEQLISFETAKLAKEKGFDIHCRFHYDEEMLNVYENEDFPYNSWNGSLFAPTQSLLQKWLREKHNIYCSAWCNASGWAWEIEKTSGTHISIMDIDGNVKGVNLDSGMFNSYEEALEDGLLKALKILN